MALPLLTDGLVITTNFDHVLEGVFRNSNRTFDLVVWGARATLVAVAYGRRHRSCLVLAIRRPGEFLGFSIEDESM
jgi:hypothetical protein